MRLSLSSLPLATTSLLFLILSSSYPTYASPDPSAQGLSFPIIGRPRPRHLPTTLEKRTGVKSTHNPDQSTMVTNSYDTIYYCNITLNGAEFEVLIDTGR
jgi:hypothetical protein